MAHELPLPAVPVLSPPEVLSAEQQHLTRAAREGPSDLGHLLAEAQLVQTPRAQHRRSCVDPHLAPCRKEGSHRPGGREKAHILLEHQKGKPGEIFRRLACPQSLCPPVEPLGTTVLGFGDEGS